MSATPNAYQQLDAWIDAHFDEQVKFLQALVQVPTDTPPGNNAPHAQRTAELLGAFGYEAEKHAVPQAEVTACGLQSITNLIVRRKYGPGRTIALNAHGDVVPPGEGWTHDPYGAEIDNGAMYGRATAVSKCDFSTFTFATRALESLGLPLKGTVELHFTYDEEFGGEVGPGWLLAKGLTKPDLMIAAGFSYQVVVAHNGCLQLEVTVHGEMSHAAIPDSGTDALQGAHHILSALYALNRDYLQVRSRVEGISHPYLNVGLISGGTNTNVIPGKVVLKLDRRMIPEEDPAQVEASLRQTIEQAAASFAPPRGMPGRAPKGLPRVAALRFCPVPLLDDRRGALPWARLSSSPAGIAAFAASTRISDRSGSGCCRSLSSGLSCGLSGGGGVWSSGGASCSCGGRRVARGASTSRTAPARSEPVAASRLSSAASPRAASPATLSARNESTPKASAVAASARSAASSSAATCASDPAAGASSTPCQRRDADRSQIKARRSVRLAGGVSSGSTASSSSTSAVPPSSNACANRPAMLVSMRSAMPAISAPPAASSIRPV